ncbi:hypothetical protein [Pseudomonas sp. RA_35y_Pfl2_P32]|uniref:hypothetical protein n=1 Tax=Pseudomonas sp. RA_35y_Pfl2_P32 TaxID=3088705 RepID=UPI0030D6D6DA
MLEEKPTKDLQDDVTVESAFEDMLIAKAKLTECTIDDYRKTFKNHTAAQRPVVGRVYARLNLAGLKPSATNAVAETWSLDLSRVG